MSTGVGRRLAEAWALVAVLVSAAAIGGCARGGGDEPIIPEAVIDVWVRTAQPIRDSFYYYIAFDTSVDARANFPVPVAAGPFWGNGWGTGSITHFLEYHNGQYNLFTTVLRATLQSATGGFRAAGGAVTSHAAGILELRVSAIALGAAQVTGAGGIAAVTNVADQNAGTISVELDASGRTIAGSVSFTPAADGGRALTATEQAQIDALNAGGVRLAADSLSALGLALTLGGPGSLSGAQTITVAPAIATVPWTFTTTGTSIVSVGSGTVRANSSTATEEPPLRGVSLTTGDLAVGDTARVLLQFTDSATLIGPPYDYAIPLNSPVLRATIDLDDLGGRSITAMSLNIITTTELIFDPTVVDPRQHVYDGLGPLGNDAVVNFNPFEFRAISNDTAFVREGAGDATLQGPGTQADRDAVDIIDWGVTPRRLR